MSQGGEIIHMRMMVFVHFGTTISATLGINANSYMKMLPIVSFKMHVTGGTANFSMRHQHLF